MNRRHAGRTRRILPWITLVLALPAAPAWSQQAVNPPPTAHPDALAALQAQMNDLRRMLVETRGEVAQSRSETAALRAELEGTRREIAELRGPSSPAAIASASASGVSGPSTPNTADRLAKLEDNQQLLTDKVNEQYQTKVESASKYRVRLSGIVLTNAFENRGSVENQDFPTWATPPDGSNSNGSVGATLRQSEIGLEVFGPDLAGAKTSASVQMDFAGGFPSDYNGVTSGIVRLRTATFRMDWNTTSLVAGQDVLFFSPLSPTSLASLAVPALSYAGNLWTWTPQIRLDHKISLGNDSSLLLQGGLLDPLTGQFPPSSYFRSPSAGEESKIPAFAGRISWSHPLAGQTFSVGLGGYYSRQDWPAPPAINSWAVTTDITLPLTSKLALTGEFYRGSATGGLSGGIGQSVVFVGAPGEPGTTVRGLDSEGGWVQLKFRATDRLEFNTAVGDDNPFTADLSESGETGFPSLNRNQAVMGNFIFRPRSDLLFSTEYKYFRTAYYSAEQYTAGQLSLSMGVLF